MDAEVKRVKFFPAEAKFVFLLTLRVGVQHPGFSQSFFPCPTSASAATSARGVYSCGLQHEGRVSATEAERV
jgi:hypothetical protein